MTRLRTSTQGLSTLKSVQVTNEKIPVPTTPTTPESPPKSPPSVHISHTQN